MKVYHRQQFDGAYLLTSIHQNASRVLLCKLHTPPANVLLSCVIIIIAYMLICIFSNSGTSAPKISCVVSLGCGIYPSAPLGNTDIADALKNRKPDIIAS